MAPSLFRSIYRAGKPYDGVYNRENRTLFVGEFPPVGRSLRRRPFFGQEESPAFEPTPDGAAGRLTR